MRVKEITKALNGLSLATVGNLLGIKLPTKGMTRCPLPKHDDGTPSFEVREHGRRWICYACNLYGGPIDLVMAVNSMEFMEAKKWLAEKSGYHFDYNKSLSPRIKNFEENTQLPNPGSADTSDETPPDHNLYEATLLHKST
jgi:DNA primase